MSLNKPVLVFAVLASLVALLAYGLRDGVGAEGMAGGPGASAASGVPARMGGGTVVAGASRPASAAPRVGSGPSPAPVPRRVQLREGFDHADDLYAYLQSLMPEAAAGDADAAWMASRVYEYCAGHAMDPAGYARDTGTFARMRFASASAMVEARERVSRRCRQFSPGDRLGRDLVILQRLEAAEAGSLAAEASLLAMGEPLDEGEDYRRDLADRVRDSADPEAFSALAPAMGMAASGDPAHAGQVAGDRLSELVWQLGACSLGLDCSPDGPLMTGYCVNGGVCPGNGSQDFATFAYDTAIPREEAEAVDEMLDSLLGGGVPR